jgi:hypothetical protein
VGVTREIVKSMRMLAVFITSLRMDEGRDGRGTLDARTAVNQYWFWKIVERLERPLANITQLIFVRASPLAHSIKRIFPRDGTNGETTSLVKRNKVSCPEYRDNSGIVCELCRTHEADDRPNAGITHPLNPVLERRCGLSGQISLRASEFRIVMSAQRTIGAHELTWHDLHEEGGRIPAVEALPERAHCPLYFLDLCVVQSRHGLKAGAKLKPPRKARSA